MDAGADACKGRQGSAREDAGAVGGRGAGAGGTSGAGRGAWCGEAIGAVRRWRRHEQAAWGLGQRAAGSRS